jgi:hypothetical protein
LYDGSIGYWLHAAFVGGLWVTQRLQKGGGDVEHEVKDLIEETAKMAGEGHPVWARLDNGFDNAYYRREVVESCRSRGWDYSISVTSETYKRFLRGQISDLQERDWEALKGPLIHLGLHHMKAFYRAGLLLHIGTGFASFHCQYLKRKS